MIPSSDLTVAAVGSNPTTAATYARFENGGLHVDLNAYFATKEGREKFASLLGKKQVYIDNATGREVCESWWPGQSSCTVQGCTICNK